MSIITQSIEKEDMIRSIPLELSSEEKVDIINALYDAYYSTDQNTEDFAVEFYYVTNKVLSGKVPVKLNELVDFEESIIDALSDANAALYERAVASLK